MSDAKSVMEQLENGFNEHDFAAMGWHANAELLCPAGHLQGREAIRAFVTGFWSAFPDARLTPARMIGDGTLAAAEGVFTGTHQRALPGPQGDLPPTGRRIEFRWASMVEVLGNEVLFEHLYWDQLEFMTQLGLLSAPTPSPSSEAQPSP